MLRPRGVFRWQRERCRGSAAWCVVQAVLPSLYVSETEDRVTTSQLLQQSRRRAASPWIATWLSAPTGPTLVKFALARASGSGVRPGGARRGCCIHAPRESQRREGEEEPCMFADAALPLLFNKATRWARRRSVWCVRAGARRSWTTTGTSRSGRGTHDPPQAVLENNILLAAGRNRREHQPHAVSAACGRLRLGPHLRRAKYMAGVTNSLNV